MFDFVKRFVASFAGSLLGFGVISWALAAYLIGAFQQTVDTNSASQNGRMDGIQQQLNLIHAQQNAFVEIMRELDASIVELNKLQKEFSDNGLDRIDALAASTDFLISQANLALSQVEPAPPVALGVMREKFSPRLSTGKSGRFVGTFESSQPSVVFVDFLPSINRNPVPALFTVTLFREDNENLQFSKNSEIAIIVNGILQNRTSLFVPGPGSYVIVVSAIPGVNFQMSSFPFTKEQ